MEVDSVRLLLEHPILEKLVPTFSAIVVLCVEKCSSDKPLDLKFIQDAARRVLCAIESDAKKAVSNDRFQSLLAYVVEIGWSFLYRTVEICGPENDLVSCLRDDLILLQRESAQLPITKGLEVSTRCLILAHRASKLNEVRDFAVSWISYFDDLFATDNIGGKSLSLAEMQRVVLFFCECSAHSDALHISDDEVFANWTRLLPVILTNGTSDNSWVVIRSIVDMEVNIRARSIASSPPVIQKTSKIKLSKCSNIAPSVQDTVSLVGVLELIAWEAVDANDLELLSRAIMLALRMDITYCDGDVTSVSSVNHDKSNVTQTPRRSSAVLLEGVSTHCQRVCDSDMLDSSRYSLFVARTYSSCLNWLQKHFQNSKEAQLSALGPELIPAIVAGEVVISVLQSLSTCTMWKQAGSSVLATLRALGNCLSRMPVLCFEGHLGSTLCSALSSCVCSLQLGLNSELGAQGSRGCKISPEQSQDIIGTCFTLASLVSGKCLGRKLFLSTALLAATTLLAASRAASASVTDVDTHRASVTAEGETLSRILSNLVTACSLGHFEAAALDTHAHPVSDSCSDSHNAATGLRIADERRASSYTAIIEACSAVLESTYAEEFLYSVCSDIQLRVCSNRPGHLPPVVDMAIAEAALLFLAMLQKAAAVRGTISEGETALVLIYFRSHCLWSAVTVPGASDTAAASVIERLKALGEDIDPLVMESVVAVRGKSKAKKAVRVEKVSRSASLSQDASVMDSLRSFSCHLRTWMLLALWGLPISAAQGDAYASDGAHGVSVYLSNACRALKNMSEAVEQQRKKGSGAEDVPLSVLFTLSADSKALYHMLGLSGRSREQVEVSTYFQVFSHLFLRCSGAGKPHSLKKEYAHTAEEIACLSKIQSAWCGDSTVGVKVTGQTAKASSGRNVDVVVVEADGSSSSSGSALRRFIEIAGQLLLTVSTGVDSAQGDTKHSACEDSVTLRSIAAFELDAENLLSPSPSAVQSSCPQSSPIIPFALSPALKAWVALLAAKTSLCVFCEHQKAYMWVRRALAYVAPRSSDAPKLGGMGGEGASCLAVDRCLPRLEGILLSAELYEQTGSTNSCLSYLVEATAIANTSSTALKNIVTLHSMRIWQRMHSARFVSALLDLCDGSSGDEFTVLASRDDVSKQVRAASRALSRLLNTDDADDDSDTGRRDDDPRSALSDAVPVPSYRHISSSWDFGPLIPSLAAPFKCYHTNVGRGDRILLASVAADCATFFSEKSSGRNTAKVLSIRPSVQRLLDGFRHSKSFDLLRDIRRMACLLSLTGRSAAPIPTGTGEESAHRISNSFLSFLLGASSCGTALECAMERSGAGTSPTGPTGLSAVSSEIAAACCNDSQALLRVESTLKSHLQISASGKDAVCFLAIEPCTKNLLVGRWDSTGSTVVALPVAEELRLLLAQWGECMDGSKALLHRTLDSTLVAKWTEADKREWWAERAASDEFLGTLLGKLEAMLGAWSSLLGGSNGREEHTAASAVNVGGGTQGIRTDKGSAESVQAVAAPRDSTDPDPDPDLSLDLNDDLLKALSGLKVTELRQQLKDKSLSVVGKKSELISRLQGHHCALSARHNSQKVCLYEDPRSIMVRSAGGAHPSTAGVGGRAARSVEVEGNVSVGICKPSSSSSSTSMPARDSDGSPSRGQRASSSSSVCATHTVLILDEVLQQIPWEVLPALRRLQCSRLPSLALLLHMLTRQGTEKVGEEEEISVVPEDEYQGAGETLPPSSSAGHGGTRPAGSITCSTEGPRSVPSKTLRSGTHTEPLRHTWFAVDPEGNLPATRDTMAAFLSPYRDKYGWRGFIGNMPSEQAAKELHNQSNLFVYCGHGAGEKICDSYKMRRWQCPSAMLWGCSSGRLTTLGVHDPHGVALNYLIGGADYIVANLWDVTDKDIDKLSMECMRTFFSRDRECSSSSAGHVEDVRSYESTSLSMHTSSATLSGALASSRNVCKLKNAVGCAPVVYGLPKIR